MRRTIIATLAAAAVATPVVATQVSGVHLDDLLSPTASQAPAAAAAQAGTDAITTHSGTDLATGASGAAVRDLQARLAAAGLFSQQPTGYYGTRTATAVSSLQRRAGLPVTGRADQATLAALQALPRTGSSSSSSTASPAPASTGQASTTPATTSPATTGAANPSPSTTAVPNPKGLDARCLTGRVMCVDKSRQRLYWVVDGVVQDSFSTRTGREGLRTREGDFQVFRMERNSWSHEYHVNMPYAMYFSGGQAVHYSADFAANGYGVGSHGCVNLRDRSGIAWLYSQVQLGDHVVVYRS